jgi:hypothetical protein
MDCGVLKQNRTLGLKVIPGPMFAFSIVYSVRSPH